MNKAVCVIHIQLLSTMKW